ncbi:MAG: hypothetical protein JSW62_00620, partial [Thermoplasmatales archaeon]
MKVIKTASGKKQIRMTKKEWKLIGKTAGWDDFGEATFSTTDSIYQSITDDGNTPTEYMNSIKPSIQKYIN